MITLSEKFVRTPRITVLVETGSPLASVMAEIARKLAPVFAIRIQDAKARENLRPDSFDLLHLCPEEECRKAAHLAPDKTVWEVSETEAGQWARLSGAELRQTLPPEVRHMAGPVPLPTRDLEPLLNTVTCLEYSADEASGQGQDPAKSYRQLWETVLRRLYFPLFRNDDVSPDTPMTYFRPFCDAFHAEGFTQIHAVTLFGQCNVIHKYKGMASEYPNMPPICYWNNTEIRKASANLRMEDCTELVDYLNTIPDELSFHGTAHVDFSKMSDEEQHEEFSRGLSLMRQLFSQKQVRYFTPPFNRLGQNTEKIARNYGLTTLKTDGIHFEYMTNRIRCFYPLQYRYHHFRYYPDSEFKWYNLSLENLQKCLHHPVDFTVPLKIKANIWMSAVLRDLVRHTIRPVYKSLTRLKMKSS